MSRLALIPLLLAVTWSAPAQAQQTQLWRLVARSDVIATGVVEFPAGPVAPRNYVLLPVSEARLLKGATDQPFVIRWFSEPGPNGLSAEQLARVAGSSSIVFALRAEEALYFAGDTPDAVQPAQPAATAAVEAEIARQAEVLASWQADSDVPHYAEVRAIIEAIIALPPASREERRSGATEQQRLFDRLVALGVEAVPAIVEQMDDDRALASPMISLINHAPGAFERTRHYGPKAMVDALAAVLNQLTGESFGFIYNGGTAAERDASIRGWRIYLDNLRTSAGD